MIPARIVIAAALMSSGASTGAATTTDNMQPRRPWGSLRGSRRTTAPPLMCNNIGCPDGYEPIPSAWEVECTGGACTVDQCCDAMCACYPCPANFIPIEDAADVFCNDGVCTTEQCCDRHGDGQGDEEPGVQDLPPPAPTPSPTFPAPPTAAFCKGFECPTGYSIMGGVDLVECEDDVCDKDECCMKDDDLAYCSTVQCPEDTHNSVDDADTKLCKAVNSPTPTPAEDGDRRSWSSSYEFAYFDDDDYIVIGGAGRGSVYEDGPYSYEYGYGYDGEEGEGSGTEEEEEYCDHRTCCVEKEYGLWGLE